MSGSSLLNSVGGVDSWVARVPWVHKILAWVKKRREWRGYSGFQVFC